MRTYNPALATNPFEGLRASSQSDTMTVTGTAQKTMILLLCLLLSSGYTWLQFAQGNITAVNGWMWLGILGGLASGFATIFKKTWAPFTAPLYAVFQGFFIGGISSMFEAQYPGIVIQAAGLTFATLGTMLFLYQSGLIEVTDKLRLGIVAATGGIAIVYFIAIVMSFFGVSVPFIFGSGWIGIAFSLFVTAIAALNLVLDFDLIERGADHGAPRYMEWYGAFALMVTLIWLYIEILRLLSKVRSR